MLSVMCVIRLDVYLLFVRVVILPRVCQRRVILLNVLIFSIIWLNVILWVIILMRASQRSHSVILYNVILLSRSESVSTAGVLMLGVILSRALMPSVILLSVIALKVVAALTRLQMKSWMRTNNLPIVSEKKRKKLFLSKA